MADEISRDLAELQVLTPACLHFAAPLVLHIVHERHVRPLAKSQHSRVPLQSIWLCSGLKTPRKRGICGKGELLSRETTFYAVISTLDNPFGPILKIWLYHIIEWTSPRRADSMFAPSQWETSLPKWHRLSLARRKPRISPGYVFGICVPVNELHCLNKMIVCLNGRSKNGIQVTIPILASEMPVPIFHGPSHVMPWGQLQFAACWLAATRRISCECRGFQFHESNFIKALVLFYDYAENNRATQRIWSRGCGPLRLRTKPFDVISGPSQSIQSAGDNELPTICTI